MTAFKSAWDGICDTPAEAAHMKIKSALLLALTDRVKSWKVTQAAAAERLGLTQPRVNELLRGKISNISLEKLIELSERAGLAIDIDVHPKEAA